MRHVNWACFTHRYHHNRHHNHSNSHESSNRKTIINRLGIIKRACHRHGTSTIWAIGYISVAVNQVRGQCLVFHFAFARIVETERVQIAFLLILDVESHHQRIQSERIGNTYSPDRIDNDSPGKLKISTKCEI